MAFGVGFGGPVGDSGDHFTHSRSSFSFPFKSTLPASPFMFPPAATLRPDPSSLPSTPTTSHSSTKLSSRQPVNQSTAPVKVAGQTSTAQHTSGSSQHSTGSIPFTTITSTAAKDSSSTLTLTLTDANGAPTIITTEITFATTTLSIQTVPSSTGGVPNDATSRPKTKIHAILAGILSGVALLSIVILFLCLLCRRKRASRRAWIGINEKSNESARRAINSTTPTPFRLINRGLGSSPAFKDLRSSPNTIRGVPGTSFGTIIESQWVESFTEHDPASSDLHASSPDSSVTAITLFPQHDLKTSSFSENLEVNAQSSSDEPPTYKSEDVEADPHPK